MSRCTLLRSILPHIYAMAVTHPSNEKYITLTPYRESYALNRLFTMSYVCRALPEHHDAAWYNILGSCNEDTTTHVFLMGPMLVG